MIQDGLVQAGISSMRYDLPGHARRRVIASRYSRPAR